MPDMISGWQVVASRSGQHVVPVNDTTPHKPNTKCFCGPSLDGTNIWVHHSADGREALERGGETEH